MAFYCHGKLLALTSRCIVDVICPEPVQESDVSKARLGFRIKALEPFVVSECATDKKRLIREENRRASECIS